MVQAQTIQSDPVGHKTGEANKIISRINSKIFSSTTLCREIKYANNLLKRPFMWIYVVKLCAAWPIKHEENSGKKKPQQTLFHIPVWADVLTLFKISPGCSNGEP